MKKIILTVFLLLTTSVIVTAAIQYYETKAVTCSNCYGYKIVTTMYGSMYCPACQGTGVQYIQVPVQNNSPSFQGAHNITLYDDDGNRIGKAIYYTNSGKVSYDGSSYTVVSSDIRKYNKKLKGYNAYFNY